MSCRRCRLKAKGRGQILLAKKNVRFRKLFVSPIFFSGFFSKEFLDLQKHGAMPTLVVGMMEARDKPHRAHDKRWHGAVLSATALCASANGGFSRRSVCFLKKGILLGGANRWDRQSAADGRGPDGPPQRFFVDACIENFSQPNFARLRKVRLAKVNRLKE